MRYRRLGRTDLLVSEAALAMRGLARLPEAGAEAAIRTAIEEGVSLVLLDAAAPDGMPALLARAAGSDRPRLTVVAHLGTVAPDEIATRLAAVTGDLGVVDVAVLSGIPDAAVLAAVEAARAEGVLRFLGIAVGSPETARAAIEVERVDVLVVPAHDEAVEAIAASGDRGVVVDGGVAVPA